MGFSSKILILFFVKACVSCVSGQSLSVPENLRVNILDGEVIVYWDKPTDAPTDVLYNVQFGLHTGEWTVVSKCTKISQTFCDVSDLIEDYVGVYKARVQLEAGGAHSKWTHKKKILPNTGDLQPPSFTMWATSSTLSIKIHKKPILGELFPYGIIYTIYLLDKERNKTTITYLKDDIWNNEMNKVFVSLRWGKEYCVTIKVEGNGGMAHSMSSPQCLILPEREWIVTAVASLTAMGVLIIAAFIAVFIVCYVKRPVNTPVALKSPASGWRPVSIVEGTMEVVTDRGWFLFSAGTEVKHVFKNLPTTYITDEKSGEEDRRPSTDSGVSMKSTSDNTRQDDSGCGSIGVQDSICSFPMQDEGSETLSTGKSDDSGLELSCHSDASSLNLENQDSGCSNKSGEYHRQRLLTVNIHNTDNDDMFKEKLPELPLISVVSGYRTNNSVCTCSGANLCILCCKQDNYRKQPTGLFQNNNIVGSCRHYSPDVQTERTETSLSLVQMEETFPMLTSLSSFPLMEKGCDFNMNDISVSLCDVELNLH
ncbi:hypothetical protein WMY93_028755 [Mugilogobius chulae]|uniref:Fibronectin type-III domain-containing protein n=1 Tax=Mugilogobius chulae TaxID=88201 RepID=A0AAW0N102_9GOBI